MGRSVCFSFSLQQCFEFVKFRVKSELNSSGNHVYLGLLSVPSCRLSCLHCVAEERVDGEDCTALPSERLKTNAKLVLLTTVSDEGEDGIIFVSKRRIFWSCHRPEKLAES